MTAPAPTPLPPLNVSLGNSGPAVSGANPNHYANWTQSGNWDPFGNATSGGPLGIPWIAWAAMGFALYVTVIK